LCFAVIEDAIHYFTPFGDIVLHHLYWVTAVLGAVVVAQHSV